MCAKRELTSVTDIPGGQTAPPETLQVIDDRELETQVAEWLHSNLFTPAKDYRAGVAKDTEWPKLRDLYEGYSEPHNPDSESANDETPSLNISLSLPTVDTVKGIALQGPASIEFTPGTPDDEYFCAVLTSIIGDYLWGVRKARFKLGVAFTEGGIVGTAWSKTFWNPDLLGGDGDVDFTILTADEVWVDPGSTGINDWQYIIHAPRRPLVEIKFGTHIYNERCIEVNGDQPESQGQKAETAEQQMEQVTPYEYWVKGPYLKQLVFENPGLEPYVDDLGWKYGMQIIVADKKVIKIEHNPNECPRFPIQRFVYYAPKGNQRIYGTGDVKYIESLQYLFESRMRQLAEQSGLIANNQWVVSNAIDMDNSEFTNKPGQIVHVDGHPDMVKRIEPTGISGSLFAFNNTILELRQIVSGMYDVNAGQTPGSLRAGVAIEALQRGGEGRTAQKVVNFDEFVADIGIGLADVMAKHYTSERVFRVAGDVAADLEALRVAREARDRAALGLDAQEGTEDTPVDPNAPQPPPQTSVKVSSKDFKSGDKMIELDCRAQVGLMLRNSMERLMKMVELMENGVVDAQYVIENNDLPNKERLLARLAAAVQQNTQPMPGAEEDDEVIAESPTGNDSAYADGDAEAMSGQIEAALAELEALEQQGVLEPGFTAQVEAAVGQEIAQGGTGEIALQQALEVVSQMMQQAPADPTQMV